MLDFQFKKYILESCDSTNSELRRQVKAKSLPNGSIIIARRQTAGRGRHERKWVSPQGNIAMSFLLPCPKPAHHSHQLNLVTALSLVSLLQQKYGLAAQLKWPNDVLINDQKIAGILSELVAEKNQVIVGVGLNYKSKRQDFPLELQNSLTTLSEKINNLPDHDVFIEEYLDQFGADLEIFYRSGLSALNVRLKEVLAWKNLPVVITDEDGSKKTGELTGLSENGFLLLKTDKDEREIIVAGDLRRDFPNT